MLLSAARTPVSKGLRVVISASSRNTTSRASLLASKRQYSTANKEVVGFIGLGQMGLHMAKHLYTKSNSKFVVYDANPSAITQLKSELGAVGPEILSATSPADLARKASVIVTVLPESAHVRDVYLGASGLVNEIKPGALCIDSSTIDPSVSIGVSEQMIEAGARAVDAPISGGIMGAKAATLTFMVGSKEESDYERAKVYLSRMGKNVVSCGPLGTGQAAKICNNLLLAISMIGTAEAMNLGIRLGLEPGVLASIINTSSGRCWSSDTSNPVPNVIESAPSSNQYDGGFKSKLMLKDLGLASTAAKEVKAPLLLGGLSESIYRHLSQGGMAEKDFGVVYKWLTESNK